MLREVSNISHEMFPLFYIAFEDLIQLLRNLESGWKGGKWRAALHDVSILLECFNTY